MLRKFLHFPHEVGTDEAGRGCLAGPVTAAAVILGHNFENEGVTDSKALSQRKRNALKQIIEKDCAHFGVAHVYPEKIDAVNILNASILAMHQAIAKIDAPIPFIIVDGNKFTPYGKIPHTCIVKGDSKFMGIAAASILAKTYRDAYMEEIHREFPMYNWKKNKGYPTKEHREAIKKYGITKYHRKSFKLLPEQLSLNF